MKILLTIFITTTADIFTKYWSQKYLPDISIFGDWVQLSHMRNTGIAFSTPLPGISIIIPLILSILLLYVIQIWRKISEKEKIGYILILTGGSLNTLERSVSGFVTDFISVRYFAVFNIADIAITLGVLILILCSCNMKRKSQEIPLQITKK